ncbi:hypothetical protein M8J77_014306 [Diaphorina citri]|nr:hypothetical protein M8J77_014306 [Diaphorina citri]
MWNKDYNVNAYHGGVEAPDWLTAKHTCGTTIIAVEFDGGVVIGADSRSSTGAYVANRVADKLTRVTDNIYCCRSGSAADTQAISDFVSYNLDLQRMELGEEPLVYSGAKLFQELVYSYRDSLTAGIICAGWDRKKGGQVYCIPLGGMLMRQKMAMGGSGSTYLYGHMDNQFKENMTKKEAMDFVTRAICHAMARDGSSGGVVRLGVITGEAPIERHVIYGKDLPYLTSDVK